MLRSARCSLSPGQKAEMQFSNSPLTFSFAFALGPWIGTAILQEFGASVLWPVIFLLGVLSSLMMRRVRAIENA